MVPVIGITSDAQAGKKNKKGKEPFYFIKTAVVEAVNAAGGSAIIIPFCDTSAQAGKIVERIDGLLVSGGDFDIPPSFYGEKSKKKLGTLNYKRTISEQNLLNAALKARKPALGICGGEQLINVFFGGTLYQDILLEKKGAMDHEQGTSAEKASHNVKIVKGSRLAAITGSENLMVNSTHHQAVKTLGKGLICSAVAKDGVIEAIEAAGDGRFVLGVQWHPEFLTGRKPHMAIFRRFVKAAGRS